MIFNGGAAWLGNTQTPACPGDCDRDGQIVVAEIVRGVSIALGGEGHHPFVEEAFKHLQTF